MSELLKIYVQNTKYIPANQLRKLNDNLLKTYYRVNKNDIDNDVMDGNITNQIVGLYRILDYDIKKKVIEHVTISRFDFHLFYGTELLKDYYLVHSEEIKKFINDILQTITGNIIDEIFIYLKLYLKYFDSDFLENINKKLVEHYLDISRQSNKKYFALNMIKILNEIGLVKFINSMYSYNHLYNTDNYEDVDDIGKRIQFLSFVIYKFHTYSPYGLEKYFDIIKEKDMFQLIVHEPFYNIDEFLKRISFDFYEKYPKVLLDLLEKNESKGLELLMPLKFIKEHGLSEKYGKYVETAAKFAWEEIKEHIFERGYMNDEYGFMQEIQNAKNHLYVWGYNYNNDFLQQVRLKLIEYYKDEKESLNLK